MTTTTEITAEAIAQYVADEDARTQIAFQIVTAIIATEALQGEHGATYLQLLGSDVPTSQRGELTESLRVRIGNGIYPTVIETGIKAAARDLVA